MDNNHTYGANNGHDGSSHGLNGNFPNNTFSGQQFDGFFNDQSLASGFDPSWSYTQSATTANSQSGTLYDGWAGQHMQSRAYPDPGGHAYTQAAAQQLQNHSQLRGYSDPQRQTSLDPSLTGHNIHDGQQYFQAATLPTVARAQQLHTQAYQPQPQQTISPSAIETTQQTKPQPPVTQRPTAPDPSVDQAALIAAIPQSQDAGIFRIIDVTAISKATTSKSIGAFVNLSSQDFEYPINKAIAPVAPARKSRKELRKLAAGDPKLLTKLGKHARKTTTATGAIRVPKHGSSIAPRTVAGESRGDVSLSDTSSSEEDSSDYDSDDEPDLPSPLPPERPDDDPKGAVRYDTIKAMWRPQRSRLPLSDIRAGLKDFWEIIRTIRDRWKTDGAAVKAAEEKGKDGELPLLKSRVRDQREMAEAALTAALEHGNKEILEVLSENKPFLYLCYQFLLDRAAQADFNCVFSRTMLKILASCVTLTEAKVKETHLVKVLPKFTKKGDDETKALVAKVEDAIKKADQEAKTEPVKAEASTEKKDGSPAASSPPAAKAPATGTKRPAPPSSAPNGPATKKVASTAPTSATSTTKPPAPVAKRPVVAAAGVKSTTAPAAGVVKTKVAAPKPTTFFNAMGSATKKATPAVKPAVSSVIAAALKSVEKQAAATPATAPAPKAGFSFADTMANLSKPKENVPAPKLKAEVAAETPEQRQRRLRKEARRGLRVTWKPDSSLNEIRLFTHDPEEYGHDANMTRDAGDLMGEGRMFKQHKDQMDLDDEDDGPGEEELRPHKHPSPVDFEEIDAEERARSFIPYGGGSLTPDSAEKPIREQHEANTLMVFYSDVSDIPPTPKEPAEDSASDDAVVLKSFGEPPEWVMSRVAKLQSQSRRPDTTVASVPAPGPPAPNLSALLAALNPQAQQSIPAQTPAFIPPVATPPAAPLANLQSILAQFGQAQSAPPAAAPQQATSQGPNAAVASLIASLQAQNAQQPQHAQPQAPAATPDIAAILATIQKNAGNAAAAPAPAAFPSGFPGIPGFAPPVPQQQQQPQDNGYGAYKHFTQPCKYWPIGRCQKGANCTYRHE